MHVQKPLSPIRSGKPFAERDTHWLDPSRASAGRLGMSPLQAGPGETYWEPRLAPPIQPHTSLLPYICLPLRARARKPVPPPLWLECAPAGFGLQTPAPAP